MIKTLTESKNLQVIGLLTLAAEHNRMLQHIDRSLQTVFEVSEADRETSGVGDPDHITDAIYSATSPPDAEALLHMLGIDRSEDEEGKHD